MKYLLPFQPKGKATLTIANAVAATSPAALPDELNQVVLYNSSATAIAFVCITNQTVTSDPAANAALTDFPIPPTGQIRITCGYGPKKISVIASAADGNLYVTPGHGN